ncbi:MAG: hypothetical protein HRT57_16505 [Crocinitomicaceae bacterium]|nr:hypothetical protein [Crocinitomicaceae bacterium]
MHRVRHQTENGVGSHIEDDYNCVVTHGYYPQAIRIFYPDWSYIKYEFLEDSTIVYHCADAWSIDTTNFPVGTWTGH